MIARDRAWNEEAAKTRLLQLFEAEGLADPWVVAQRRSSARSCSHERVRALPGRPARDGAGVPARGRGAAARRGAAAQHF